MSECQHLALGFLKLVIVCSLVLLPSQVMVASSQLTPPPDRPLSAPALGHMKIFSSFRRSWILLTVFTSASL